MKPKIRKICLWLCTLFLILTFSMICLSFMSKRPENLGVQNGRLNNCPETPNCVCSFEDKTDKHFIEPFAYSAAEKDVTARLKEILNGMPRTKIVEQSENYISAECTSLLFRFTDDLEFYIDSEKKLLHFRSASRIGHSDLGVNRKRLDSIKEKLKGL